MTKSSDKLKLCPFCGGEARRRDFGRGRVAVACLNIDCRATSMLALPGEDAIAAWNTRASQRADNLNPEALGDLYEALERLRSFLISAPFEPSGVCCCGDPVEGHNIGSGHAPVDMLSYAVQCEIDGIDEALAKARPQP